MPHLGYEIRVGNSKIYLPTIHSLGLMRKANLDHVTKRDIAKWPKEELRGD